MTAGTWSLRLQGVGNAFATELGSAMATIERDGAPWLSIDCGSDGLTHYLAHYGDVAARGVHHACAPGPCRRLRAPVRRELLGRRAARARRAVRARAAGAAAATTRRVVTRTRWPKAAPTSGTPSSWCPSAITSGTTACAWKSSRRATTGPTPASACACAAAWCGRAIRGRFPNSWRSSPMPANWSLHDCALARQSVAQRHRRSRARISARNCSHAAACTTTRATADGAHLEVRGHRIARAGEVIALAPTTATMAPMR